MSIQSAVPANMRVAELTLLELTAHLDLTSSQDLQNNTLLILRLVEGIA